MTNKLLGVATVNQSVKEVLMHRSHLHFERSNFKLKTKYIFITNIAFSCFGSFSRLICQIFDWLANGSTFGTEQLQKFQAVPTQLRHEFWFQ